MLSVSDVILVRPAKATKSQNKKQKKNPRFSFISLQLKKQPPPQLHKYQSGQEDWQDRAVFRGKIAMCEDRLLTTVQKHTGTG